MSFLVTPTAKGLALARTTALTAMNLLGAEYLTAMRIVKGLAVTGMNALATTTLKGKAIARIDENWQQDESTETPREAQQDPALTSTRN
ncbi:hypothetical protein D6C76_09524 [Aureobasidium pullulans]|nr:hypothetical protein D6C76_09524 [Aureobasidium pullulans]